MSAKPGSDFDVDMVNIFVHDLKNPLSAIKSYVELIQEYGELNERQHHFSERAILAVDRVQRIVHDMLDFVRVESDTPLRIVEVDMGTLVRGTVELVEDARISKQIQIHIDVEEELSRVAVDEALLSHVILNLLSNAVKYNKENGDIWMRVRDERAFIRIDVEDTGRGIEPEDQPHVFDKFFRAKSNKKDKIEGNGLGLALAKAVVLKHGGHIWLESKPGFGSVFSFTLPHQPIEDSASSESSPQQPATPFDWHHDRAAQEDIDDMDDNLQEPPELSDTDSNSDELYQ